jgi:hypothetical protein
MKTQLLKPMCALLLSCLISSTAMAEVVTMVIKGDTKINTSKDGSGDSLSISAGTQVQLLGKAGDTGRIMVDGTFYYIPLARLEASQNEAPDPAPARDTAAVAAKTMYVTSDGVRVRKTPEINSSNIMTQLDSGSEVQMYETVGDFVHIKTGGQDGYMSASFLSSKKPEKTVEGCTRSLNPNDPSNKGSDGKAIVNAIENYVGVGSLNELLNTTWTAIDRRSKGTVFSITGNQAFHVRIIDLPEENWDNLTDAAHKSGGLAIFASKKMVQDKVREGDFTGRLCLTGQGRNAKIAVHLDGSINGEGKSADITIIPTGNKQYKVNGTFAGEELDGTFTTR